MQLTPLEMKIIEVKDGILPCTRDITADEMTEIKALAEKEESCKLFHAITAAYYYGFWNGWKHCEAERVDYDRV